MKFNFTSLVLILAFCMAFFLPLHLGISNLFLILFLVASAYLLLIKKEYVLRNPRLLIFTLLPLFLLYVIGVFYSSPPFVGTKMIGRTISFLLCPLILLFYSKSFIERIKMALYKGIVIGSLLAVIILLINNFLNYFATRPFLNFDEEIFSYSYTYHSFTEMLDIYPTYLGAYVLFAILLLLKGIFSPSSNLRWLRILGVVILSAGVLFLNSRIILLIYALLLIIATLYGGFLLFKSKSYIGTVALFLLLVFIGVFSFKMLSNTFIFSRFSSELNWELSEQIGTTYNSKTSADSRIARWEAALQAISEHPIIGYGTYTEKDILGTYYLKNDLMVSYENRYDAHNMYLSMAVEYGIIGVLLFIFYLGSNFWFAIKYRDVELSFLIFMIGVISCFESYIGNNAAITFIALFGTVFLFSHMPILKRSGDGKQ